MTVSHRDSVWFPVSEAVGVTHVTANACIKRQTLCQLVLQHSLTSPRGQRRRCLRNDASLSVLCVKNYYGYQRGRNNRCV